VAVCKLSHAGVAAGQREGDMHLGMDITHERRRGSAFNVHFRSTGILRVDPIRKAR